MALASAAASVWALAGFSEDNKKENNTMSFQAPFDTMDYARLQMVADQQKAEQQQQYMGQIFGALADVGAMFQKQEEMNAGVKAGEQFGKMFGKQLGMNMDFMSAPEYKNADTATKYQFWQGNFFPSMGAMSNMLNTSRRLGVQQRQPYVNAGLQNAGNLASGEGTVPLPNNPAPYGGPVVEPPFPEGDPAGAETLPPVRTSTPSPDAMSAADSWWKNKSSGSPMQSGSMKPFWR